MCCQCQDGLWRGRLCQGHDIVCSWNCKELGMAEVSDVRAEYREGRVVGDGVEEAGGWENKI